ncbi:hypothetical protein AVEN_76724-1 [Araneus ventricosus]|uniref:HAT C-terminal dimerisation domain-containing protein n=1 Tax=Araneus ventricosus TaxID=182803 RepID=A0A4Y2BQT3_ARAVE|nr:hypothetical protein AVEN_76724-1 [Araneus ventricosus]
MFPIVDEFIKTYNVEEKNVKIVFVTIENHLAMLTKNFKKCFLADENLVASYEWLEIHFEIAEEEIFIHFKASGEIKRQFSNKSVFAFWTGVDDEFSALKTRAFRILLTFSASYLCETEFSEVAALKTEYRSQLNIEKEFRVSISNIKPSIEKLCSARQAKGSH